MFFVGATGQLLTLILTVCLPFVFLVSSQSKTEFIAETSDIYQTDIYTKTVSYETHSDQTYYETAFILSDLYYYFETTPQEKYPPGVTDCCHTIFCQTSSGNKAPPVFRCYSC